MRSEGTWREGKEKYRALKVGLTMSRQRLYERLDARVDRFFESGLIEEVRELLARGVPPEANAFKAIGYREVLLALTEGHEAEDVRDDVRRSTRRLAKRQLTWFRREPNVVWLDADAGMDELVERVVELWRSTVGAASW